MGTVISITPAQKKVKPSALDTLAEKAWERCIIDRDKALKLSRELLELSEEIDYEKGKALAYRNISYINLKNSDAGQSLNELQKALDIFKKIKYENGIADCYRIFGLNVAGTNNFADALTHYLKAYEIYTLQGNEVNAALVLRDIGLIYTGFDVPEIALGYFTDALETVSQLREDTVDKANMLFYAGVTYFRIDNFKQSFFYLNESYKISKKLKYQLGQVQSLHHLGELKFKEGAFPEALKFHNRAVKGWKQVNDIFKVADTYFNIGLCKFVLRKYKEAGSCFLKALLIYEKSPVKNQAVDTELQLARVKIKSNELSAAEKLLNKALVRAVQLADPGIELKGHELYADYFTAINQPEKALYHTSRVMVLNGSINKKQREEYAKNVDVVLATEKKRRQIDENSLHTLYHAKKDKALNELLAVKQDILRHASHDLKSPLNSIKGLVNLLSNSYNSKRQIKEYTDLIEEAADQMLKLVNDIQQASLVESGLMECKPVLFDLVAQAKLCANSFLVQTQQKKQSITIRAPKPFYVFADKEKINSVLTNLISNASKFSYLNQQITISFSTGKGTTRCLIKDQGQGLTRTDLKDAFQQFKKLSARPTGDEESIGLGLFICKKLVEANKGKITAESEGRNKGSRFIFELPNCIEINEN